MFGSAVVYGKERHELSGCRVRVRIEAPSDPWLKIRHTQQHLYIAYIRRMSTVGNLNVEFQLGELFASFFVLTLTDNIISNWHNTRYSRNSHRISSMRNPKSPSPLLKLLVTGTGMVLYLVEKAVSFISIHSHKKTRRVQTQQPRVRS